jgi:hypothetical protein
MPPAISPPRPQSPFQLPWHRFFHVTALARILLIILRRWHGRWRYGEHSRFR